MKLVKITEVEPFDLHDITVADDHCFELANGVIAHNSMYPKTIIPGGTAVTYSANSIFVITKSQEKEGTELAGWQFTINIHKSRYVKEKSKLPFKVMYSGGIQKYSGILDLALEGNFVAKPKQGWYCLVNQETGELEEKNFRAKEFDTPQYAGAILENSKFKQFVIDKYKLSKLEMDDNDNFVSESDSDLIDE